MRGIGIGVRGNFWEDILSRSLPIDFVEITADHFFDTIQELDHIDHYPIAVHSLSLSLGSPEPIDDDYLNKLLEIAERVDAMVMSDHLAFTQTRGIDLGHLNPIPLNNKLFSRIKGKVNRIQQASGRRFLLENITSHLTLAQDIPEAVFLSELAHKTGCGILLDVTNLYVNAVNHNFDPMRYITDLDLNAVSQVHLIGYSKRDGVLQDDHAAAVQQELLTLLEKVLTVNPDIPVLVEWDRNFPTPEALHWNLKRISETIDGCGHSPVQIAGR